MGLFDRLRTGGRRAAVVGLDGVGFPLVQELVARGVMPRLGAFMESGSAGPMRSSVPTVSSVSWANFLTGSNPGRHGIYGFTDIDRERFKQYFPGFRHLCGDSLIDILDRHGKRVVVVNVPGTYPAREVPGVLISGFVAIKLEKAVHPPSLLPRLREAGYRIDVDYLRANERPREFFADLFETLNIRRRVLVELAREQAWDLFIGVVTESDRLHHYFWHAWEDEESPYHEKFVAFYAALDELIGELIDSFGDAAVMVMADHGHMLIRSEFYPNVVLRERGLLKFRTGSPRTVADIHPDTKAFVLDPGRIYLNLKGRYPIGGVEPAESGELLDEIASMMSAVEFEGDHPVSSSLGRDRLYQGGCADRAPDMVLQFNPGFDIKGSLRAETPFGLSALTGMHTYDDSFFCAAAPGMDLAAMDIMDIAPTLLGALGLAGGEAMDGRDRGLA